MAREGKHSAAAARAALDAAKDGIAEAAQAGADAPKMAGPKGCVVLVRGPEDGRRRGGLSFGPVDVEIDLGDIAEADMRAILADPDLSVRAKPADEGEGDKAEA